MDNPGFGRQSGRPGCIGCAIPKGDGSFTTIDTLRTWDGDEGGHSDHGIHEARVSPDGKHFYIINGNGVVPPPDVSPNSPLRNYADDRIIPLLGPQTGRLGHEKAPGGTIARTTFEGKDFHLFAGGMRNALHFDWNADGEIFSFDSDMEPEFGVPWYRPVRVFWMPSGADLGYRGNSGKYPTWYEDSLPPLVEIGLGSPVGVTFGYRTAFPAKYQKALYVADNNYGRIIAVHLEPVGQRLRRDVVGELHLAEVALRRDAAHAAQRHRHDRGAGRHVLLRHRQPAHAVVSDEGDLRRQPADRARRVSQRRRRAGPRARAARSSSSTGRATIPRRSPRRGRTSAARIDSCASPRASRSRRCRPTSGRRGRWPNRTPRRRSSRCSRWRASAGRRRTKSVFTALRKLPALDAVRSAAHSEAPRHRGRGQPERQAVRRRRSEGHRRRRRGVPRLVVRAEHRDVADPRGLQRARRSSRRRCG